MGVRKRRMLRELSVAIALFIVALGSQAIAAHAAFDPQAEARNFSKINERSNQEHGTPAYKALLAQQAIDDELERADIALNDPERNFSGNLCAQHKDGCAGDVRLYRWAQSGYGLTYPILYTARSGAIISGHVWATRDGPPKRPGIVITTGSVQAPEELYLFAATTLAKKGYVVMTYDVQGQGRSDTQGEEPDQNEGVPAQQPANFINGTEDALNFFLSTPESNYVPLPSDSSATVHSARQDRRVAEGRNAAFNPAFRMLDTSRIGIIGHSLGASAVSTVCCQGHTHLSSTRSLPGTTCRSRRVSPRACRRSACRPTTAWSRHRSRRSRTRSRRTAPRAPTRLPESTPRSSTSAAVPTTSGRTSPTRGSARPGAAWTWPRGTPPPGSTST